MNPASRVVRRWVALYTHGLATELRDQRRAEIESDLWAEWDEADMLGPAPLPVAVEILARLVLGIPADIGWRYSHLEDNSSSQKEIVVRESRSQQAWTVAGALWAGLGIVFAVVLLLDIQSRREDLAADVWAASALAVVIIVATGAALIGLLRIGRDPATGRQVAIAGALVAGATAMFLLSWMWVIGIVLAVPLVVVAIVRARQVLESGRRQSA